jgi:glyoxylase-like metal-dependent hydrolase (beta-lactamase superfamily II)
VDDRRQRFCADATALVRSLRDALLAAGGLASVADQAGRHRRATARSSGAASRRSVDRSVPEGDTPTLPRRPVMTMNPESVVGRTPALGPPATPRAPFTVPRPLLARLTAPAGPPAARLVEHNGAAVMAVPGRYSVTYLLLGPDAVVVVDVGSAADVPLVLRALAWLGRPPAQVRAVVPTHLHFDHVMGVDALARRLGVPVLLGDVAAAHVRAGRSPRFPGGWRVWRAILTWPMQGLPFFPLADWRGGLDFGFPWARNQFRAPLAPPLADGVALPGPPGWTVLHTPGHADDALCLYHAAARFLVAGDTVRNFLGGEWNPLLVARDAMRTTRARLSTLEVETVFPAHGPVLEGPGVLARLRDPVLLP